MLKSQKVQLRLSELKERINGMELTKANDAEFLKGRADLAEMEKEYRQAVEGEAKDTDVFGGEDSSEHREALQVTRKADLGVLVGALVSKRSLHSGSAEAEAQNAWGLAGDNIPLAMLAEYRVAAAPC